MLSKTVATLLTSAALVAAHGVPTDVWVGGKWYPGTKNWDAPENKQSPVRRIPADTGFVPYREVNDPKYACSSAGSKGTPVVAPVQAGGQIKIRWGGDKGPDGKQWPHPEGPAIAYLARCDNDDCKNFNPANAQFFKISEEGLDTSKQPIRAWNDHMPAGDGLWAQNKGQMENSEYSFTIPPDISAGEYLVRHDLISLHGAHSTAEGAQLYPACVQIKVTGGGNAKPKTTHVSQLYTVQDGIVNIWEPYPKGIKNYKIPGPALYVPGKAQAPAPAPPPPSSKPPSNPAPSTSKPTSTSKPYQAAAPVPTKKTCKPKKKSPKRSVADETKELYGRALARHAHGTHLKRASF
ncbi:hypothetical protein FRC12_023974 [Ceratobasidium sp. 428]|nr:hypothetical protein FRC12_023974 [Ceratobasidium sp. 428]